MRTKRTVRSFRGSIFLLVLMLMMVLMVAIFAVSYHDAYSTMKYDALKNSQNATIQMKSVYEVVFQQLVTINNYNSLDINVQSYMNSEISLQYQENIEKDLHKLFEPHRYIQNYIYGMGIYASENEMVWLKGVNNSGSHEISTYADHQMLEYIDSLEPGCKAFYHHWYGNHYPYVMTIIKKNKAGTGAVFMSVNLKKLKNYISEDILEGYIISDDGTILYSNDSNEIGQDVTEVTILSDWTAGEYTQEVKNDNKVMIVSSVKSDGFDWYYATIQDFSQANLSTERMRFITILVVLCGLTGLIVAFASSRRASKPLEKIMVLLDESQNMTHTFTYAETRLIAQKLSAIISANQSLKVGLEDTLREFNSLQNTALQYQVNPHFLYNTLNAVSVYLSKTVGPRHESVSMIVKLSQILRYSLDAEDSLVALKDEATYAELYVDIIKRRHQELFEVYFDIAEDLLDAKVLRMSLQPLIENAIYHGIQPVGSGELLVSAKREDEKLVLIISDNGIGITEDEVELLNQNLQKNTIRSKHIGMANVYRRIQLLFGAEYGLHIESEKNKGTRVVMTIPYIEDPKTDTEKK